MRDYQKNEREEWKMQYFIGYVKGEKVKTKWNGEMSEREAQEYTVSLYTRLSRKGYKTCYWRGGDEQNKYVFDGNWVEMK